jgi:hypothetical protein
MVAKRFSRCVVCTATIAPGDEIEPLPENHFRHADCTGPVAKVATEVGREVQRRAWSKRREEQS